MATYSKAIGQTVTNENVVINHTAGRQTILTALSDNSLIVLMNPRLGYGGTGTGSVSSTSWVIQKQNPATGQWFDLFTWMTSGSVGSGSGNFASNTYNLAAVISGLAFKGDSLESAIAGVPIYLPPGHRLQVDLVGSSAINLAVTFTKIIYASA